MSEASSPGSRSPSRTRHSKLIGEGLRSGQRRVLEHMGCEVVEMRHTGVSSLCCGLGHGASRFSPIDMTFGTVRRLREARATGAERLVVYCNSCDLLFSVGTQLTPFIIPVWHVNELICEALGQPVPRLNLSRARSMVAQLFGRGAPKVISPRRIYIGS
jgi:heterodisulfide reductase subunit B